MNRNKIKFKYLMNLWKSLPSYPNSEDIIYELCAYLEKDGRPNGEFTFQTFNSIWGSKWMETKHHDLVQSMIGDGSIIEIGGEGSNKKKLKLRETPDYI